jgi:hypothetical protein
MFEMFDPPTSEVLMISSFTVIVIDFETTFDASGVPNPRTLYAVAGEVAMGVPVR